MPIYLVERYVPDLALEEIQSAVERLAAAADEMISTGIPLKYLGCTFIPEDEACFCEFEAPTVDAVARANDLAAFPYARILVAERLRDFV